MTALNTWKKKSFYLNYRLLLTNYLEKGGEEGWNQQNFCEHVCKDNPIFLQRCFSFNFTK